MQKLNSNVDLFSQQTSDNRAQSDPHVSFLLRQATQNRCITNVHVLTGNKNSRRRDSLFHIISVKNCRAFLGKPGKVEIVSINKKKEGAPAWGTLNTTERTRFNQQKAVYG